MRIGFYEYRMKNNCNLEVSIQQRTSTVCEIGIINANIHAMVNKTIFTGIILIYIVLSGCAPYTPTSSSRSAIYNHGIHDSKIKSVEFYPVGSTIDFKYLTPVIPLNSNVGLMLEFDDLSGSNSSLMARVEKMTADWKPSYLNGMEYLNEYNEFRLSDYNVGLDTKVGYVHYKFQLPQVTNSGNYLLIIYQEGYEDQPLLSRRFVVFENKIKVGSNPNGMAFTTYSGHSIDFEVNYNGHEFADPWLHMKATIRQNNRWDNSLSGINPSQVKEDLKTARFQYFDGKTRFNPGNEFRFFDIRSLVSPGQNVVSIDREAEPVTIQLATDKSRNGLAYSFHRDINGNFDIINFDNRNSTYYSDYVRVFFQLETNELEPADEVYIFGNLTDWELNPDNKMQLVSPGIYGGSLLIKQGWYDYQYLVKGEGKSTNFLEGDHINTENFYEILIYDTNPMNRHQYCIGYLQFGINERIR